LRPADDKEETLAKTRALTRGLLLVCGGLTLTLVAAMATRQPVAPSSAASAQGTLPPSVLASLPPGEIQAVSEQNGARVIVVRPAVPSPVPESAAAEGQVAFVDPATGRLREATPEDHQALKDKAALGRRSLRRAEPEERASGLQGGGFYMEVPDSVTVYSVAHRAADGSLVVGDAQGGENAVSVVRAPARPAAGKERRHDR
jgi:hypothetical protein